MPGRGYDLVGKRFGRLLVIKKEARNDKHHENIWICRCDCGNEKKVTTGHLTTGTVASCGCIKKEMSIKKFQDAAKNNITHGESGTPLYNIWRGIKQRCYNPKNPGYRWYGAKGIKLCDEWHDYKVFAKWSMENGYIDNHDLIWASKISIDRIDSNKDYSPDNCQWITMRENSKRQFIKDEN